jgi:hypothetical protein
VVCVRRSGLAQIICRVGGFAQALLSIQESGLLVHQLTEPKLLIVLGLSWPGEAFRGHQVSYDVGNATKR